MTSNEGSVLLEAIAANILRIIPVTAEKAEEAAKVLYDLKLRRLQELAYVQETDLAGTSLSPFEIRQLLDAWKGSSKGQDKENRPPVIVEGQEEKAFKINWKDIYAINKDIKNRLILGKKLKRKEKKELVSRLVQQVRDTVPHATRSIFDQVAKELKRKYPNTFKSELAEGTLAKKTLGFKMKTKFDNDKRPARQTSTEKQAPAIKAAYGCLRWRVVDLPNDHTEESLEEKRLSLELYFESRRPNAWDWEFISREMEVLYGQQRAEINRQAEEIMKSNPKGKRKQNQNQAQQESEQQAPVVITTTQELRDRWPFLFVPSGMLMHFTKLTDVNLEEKLENFIDSDVVKIVDFLQATNSGDKRKKSVIRKINQAKVDLSENSSVPCFAACILLLIQRFKENKEALWLMVDEHCEEEAILEAVQIPLTPCLVIKGTTIFTEGTIYFCMDRQVLGTAVSFVQGIAMLFASYYVFNLEYASEAQITLEFLQRIVAGINPVRGNKRPKRTTSGRASTKTIHHILGQFSEKYDEYLADNTDSNEDSTD